ncbi:hypothetical protein F5879DRAFT_994902 [Lentinula edodes]|nr:hypothetical protein F5879DRAFT_994902 [Lentinula edodes]
MSILKPSPREPTFPGIYLLGSLPPRDPFPSTTYSNPILTNPLKGHHLFAPATTRSFLSSVAVPVAPFELQPAPSTLQHKPSYTKPYLKTYSDPGLTPIHFIQSPVSVPSASVRLPYRIGSCMDHHHIVEQTPSRIMHQPRPHCLVDLDHISTSAQLLPETQSALAVMSEFPQEHHHLFHNHPNIPWVHPPPHAPADHSYPMYYAPYPVYQNFQPPPASPRPMTPRFKIKYSSIHVTFLVTIKDADSQKDRKSWDTFAMNLLLEIEARLKWDKNDGWTSSILTARLSDEARNHLPPMINDQGECRTARQIYLRLKGAYQAAPDRKACLHIQDELLNSQIHGMDIKKFNLKWSSTLTTLQNYGYDIPWDTLISKYILKLPSGPRYVYLKQTLEEDFDQPGVIPNRNLFDKFAICLENTRNRELLDLANSGGGAYNRCFQRNGTGGTSDKPPEQQKLKDSPNMSKPNNKLSAYVTTTTSPTSNTNSKIETVDTVNSVPSVISTANTTVCSTYPARHLKPFAALLSSFPSSPLPIHHSEDDNPIAFSSIPQKTQTLLDSACTNHIIKNRRFFFTFDEDGTLAVQTANSGILATKALGTCYFELQIDGTNDHLILEMHDCLYAPNAPVNLLSVGAMLEHRFTFTISPQTVQIHPDPDHFAIADVI